MLIVSHPPGDPNPLEFLSPAYSPAPPPRELITEPMASPILALKSIPSRRLGPSCLLSLGDRRSLSLAPLPLVLHSQSSASCPKGQARHSPDCDSPWDSRQAPGSFLGRRIPTRLFTGSEAGRVPRTPGQTSDLQPASHWGERTWLLVLSTSGPLLGFPFSFGWVDPGSSVRVSAKATFREAAFPDPTLAPLEKASEAVMPTVLDIYSELLLEHRLLLEPVSSARAGAVYLVHWCAPSVREHAEGAQ